ncbi:MAG: FecR domain-containing protein [Polyangiaceae bacterium]
MDDVTKRLSHLGRAVAAVSDRAADPTTLQNARRRFLSGTAEETPRALGLRGSLAALFGKGERRRPALVAGLSLSFAAACLAALLLVFTWRREPAISFTTDGSPGAVGQWVAPEGTSALALHFSEGTRVSVEPGARMRVTETSSNGATILIERGTIHAAITHRDERTRWSVQAGPFEVRVTGTAFDARWDPATETFELKMVEGSVVVSGPRLPSGRSVVAGELLLVSTNHMELRAGAAPAACATATAPVAANDGPAATNDGPAATSAPTSAPAATAQSGDASSWKVLARAGKHREAMDAAEAAGFSAEVARASASDLLALSDTARFAGRPARAKEALLALRKRFGAKGQSAFLLGKISADQLRSPGEAATWFEIYLQEEPGGPLAEQALGRLLEIHKREPGAARLVAERYLARYPNGAYAALARSLSEPK